MASDRVSRGLNLCVPEDRASVSYALERLPATASRAREIWLLSGTPGGDPVDDAQRWLGLAREQTEIALIGLDQIKLQVRT